MTDKRDIVDELTKVYADAEFSRQGTGIAAVVRAMRDCLFPVRFHPLDTEDRHIWDCINEILGDAGDDAAGASTGNPEVEDDGRVHKHELSPLPAADFCEWKHDDDETSSFDAACGGKWCQVFSGTTPIEEGYNHCPTCGKPVKFTEVI